MKVLNFFTLLTTIFLLTMPLAATYSNFQTVGKNAQDMKMMPGFGSVTKSQDQNQLKSTVNQLSDDQIKEISRIDELYKSACVESANFITKKDISLLEINKRKEFTCATIIATSGSKMKDYDLASKILWLVPLFAKDVQVDLSLGYSDLRVLGVNNNQKFLNSFSNLVSKCVKEACPIPESVKKITKFISKFLKQIEEARVKVQKKNEKANQQGGSQITSLGRRMLLLKKLKKAGKSLWKKKAKKSNPVTQNLIAAKKAGLRALVELLVRKMDFLIVFIERKIPKLLQALIKNPRERLLKGTKINMRAAQMRCEQRFGKGTCLRLGSHAYVYKCSKGKKPVMVNSYQFRCVAASSKPIFKNLQGAVSQDSKMLDFNLTYDMNFVEVLDK